MSVTREEFDALLERVVALETNAAKSTPKKKTPSNEHLALAETVTRLEAGSWLCTHCFKTGKNKDMFCSSISKLHYKGDLITDNTVIMKEYHGEIRCGKHSNGSSNKGINHGAKLLSAHYGISDSDSVVTKDEENPDEKVAALLGGNSAGIVTTPSKAFADRKVDKKYIEYGEEYLHELIEKDDEIIVIEHTKSKNGTPKKRPSPRAIGVCKLDEKDDYLTHLVTPSDGVLASIGLKYKPLEEEEEEEEEKEDIGAGLTAVKQPVVLNPTEGADPYEATTDTEENKKEDEDEDLSDLLNDLA